MAQPDPSPFILFLLLSALAVFAVTLFLYNRRTRTLASVLDTQVQEAAAALEKARLDQDLLLRENEGNARRERQRAAERDATLRVLEEGVVTCDAAGRLLSLNRAGEVILSHGLWSPEERVEAWAARIRLCYPSGQPVPAGAIPLTRALRAEQCHEREDYAVYTDTGEKRLIEMTATPVFADDSEKLSGAVAAFRDVTALRHSQAQEMAANRRIEVLAGISRRLTATQEKEEMIPRIITEGALLLLPNIPGLHAFLYESDPETRMLTLQAMRPEIAPARNLAEKTPKRLYTQPFNAASPLLWPLYVSRQTVISGDLQSDPRFADPTDSLPLRGGIVGLPAPQAAMALPFIDREVVSGHLLLTSSLLDAFSDPRLVDPLTSLASLAVIALANARLYEQTMQRVKELNALWTVGEAAASNREMTEVVDTLTDQVRRVIGAQACVLSLFYGEGSEPMLHEQGDAWRQWALAKPSAEPDCLCESCDRITFEAAHGGKPASLIGQPNPEYPFCRWRAFSGLSGNHSVLSVPLRDGLGTLGALTAWVSGGRPFSPEQVKLLGTLGNLAAAAARNTQHSK